MVLAIAVVVLEILGSLAGIVMLAYGVYDRKIKLFALGVAVIVLSSGLAAAVLSETPTPKPEIKIEQSYQYYRWGLGW